jgi:hypothetical protein
MTWLLPSLNLRVELSADLAEARGRKLEPVDRTGRETPPVRGTGETVVPHLVFNRITTNPRAVKPKGRGLRVQLANLLGDEGG